MSIRQKRICLLWALVIVLSLLVACATGLAPLSSPTTSPPLPSEIPAVTNSEPTTPATSPLSQEITPAQTKEEQELKIHFIDVGQGDAILIDLKDVEVLIDGGDRSPGVVPYLKKYIDGPIEAMVATHPHADHIGGLIDALATF